MPKPPARLALGLMSGTSLDGIDAAVLRSDGRCRIEPGPSLTVPYDEGLRARLRGALGGCGDVSAVEREMTQAHAAAVRALLAEAGLHAREVDVVGFHGHTIRHAPEEGRTWQIGDGALLARETGIDVVCDFRSRDMAEGGQGAPLAPLYHAAIAIAHDLPRPLAVLNVGGVANVTWIGDRLAGGGRPTDSADLALLAFDTGPGNALLDDWMLRQTGQAMDRGGALARSGHVDERALRSLLANPYFALRPPKSLDRDAFDPRPVADLGAADGAATLTAFTAAAVAAALPHLPAPPARWLVTGGGRKNAFLMSELRERLEVPVEEIEVCGCDGNALEAHAFAYLALRSLDGLPLSLPGTTGVAHPTTGGVRHRARRS